MLRYVLIYIACAVVFFALDFVWLSTMVKSLYRREIGDLLLDKPNLAAAGLFYLLYLLGVVVLVVIPANNDIVKALWTGALFGLVAYGTYDLTNLSTIRGFTPTITVIDLIWGTALTAVAATAATAIGSRIG
jgi:uncharacterized membrane protein